MKPIFYGISFSFLFLGLSFLITSCATDDCLEQTIDRFKAEQGNCPNAQILKYSFQDEEVYLFAEGTCFSDALIQVTNTECELICELGGIGGFTECSGEVFVGNAELLETIWEN